MARRHAETALDAPAPRVGRLPDKPDSHEKARPHAFLIDPDDFAAPIENVQDTGHDNPDIENVALVVFIIAVKR